MTTTAQHQGLPYRTAGLRQVPASDREEELWLVEVPREHSARSSLPRGGVRRQTVHGSRRLASLAWPFRHCANSAHWPTNTAADIYASPAAIMSSSADGLRQRCAAQGGVESIGVPGRGHITRSATLCTRRAGCIVIRRRPMPPVW